MKEKNSFKFRAWDEKLKVMITLDTSEEELDELCEKDDYPSYLYEVDEWYPVREIDILFYFNYLLKNERLKFMQSTGLKDKNGEEIYESDIVIAWSQGVKGIFEIKRRIDGLWLLYPAWKDGQFWYLRPTEDGRESCEVIGNIYANKDLLEVENE